MPTKANSLNGPAQSRTKEFLCKPAEEQHLQLTTIGSHRDEKRFIPGMQTSATTFCFLVANLSNQKRRNTTGRSGRGCAQRGGRAVQGKVGRDTVGSIWPENNLSSCSPANRKHCPERFFGSKKQFHLYLIKNLSTPKPRHTTGGSCRGARRGDEAGSGRTVCKQNCPPREQSFLALSKASRKRRLNAPPEAQTSEIPCKPMGKQNPRLTNGSSAVYPRFISETRSALFSWLPNSGTAPFCPCKPFPCRACPGTMEKQNLRFTLGLSAVDQPDDKRSLLLAADKCTDIFLSL